MEFAINTVYYIIPFIILLGILVFVHEFGHFIIARLSGVKVSAFSIGFGKKIWSRTDKHGTEWIIATIPLGGYCQFLGDADASSTTSLAELKEKMSENDRKASFLFQPAWKRLLIAIAGPSFNYLFAIVIFAAIFYFAGQINFPPIIGEVIKDSPAEAAMLQKNDRIISINGHKINDFSDINVEVSMAADGNVKLEVLRGGETLNIDLKLKEIEVEESDGTTSRRPMIGIKSISSYEITRENYGLWRSFCEANKKTWNITTATLRGVGQMFTGKRDSKELGGIIRIAEMSGDISKSNDLLDFVIFMAVLSINLGLINLFPIPALDGGHIVFCLIEMLTGREINEKAKMWMFKIGLALILALMIFATWNDIVHLFNRWFS